MGFAHDVPVPLNDLGGHSLACQKGRDEDGPGRSHGLDGRVVEKESVFDGISSGAGRGGRPGGAVSVSHDPQALAMRLVDDGSEFLVTEHRPIGTVAPHRPVTGREDLDDVRAELHELADLRPERIGAIGHGPGDARVRTQVSNPVGVRGSYGPAEGESCTSETSSLGPGTSPAAMASR